MCFYRFKCKRTKLHLRLLTSRFSWTTRVMPLVLLLGSPLFPPLPMADRSPGANNRVALHVPPLPRWDSHTPRQNHSPPPQASQGWPSGGASGSGGGRRECLSGILTLLEKTILLCCELARGGLLVVLHGVAL